MRHRLAVEWTVATAGGLVVAHLAFELLGAAVLGYSLLLLLPFIGGPLWGIAIGAPQSLVLRRYYADNGSWFVATLLGCLASWILSMALAAALFVPRLGLDSARAFLSLALPTPIVGWAQSRVLRRRRRPTRLWIVASTVGWVAFVAVEMFLPDALPAVNAHAGRFVSTVAGYSVASSLGATLLAGTLVGVCTGIAASIVLGPTPVSVSLDNDS